MNASSHSIKRAREKQDNVHCDIPPTLTQSGLLAELLRYRRRKVIELTPCRTRRKHVRAIFWSSLTRLVTAAHDITTAVRGCVLPRKR
jgi:hypothetical protein